jgi:ADP-ribose pyrophosphatase
MQWKIKQRRRNYDGHFKVDQFVIQHELFSGGLSHELTREQVSRQNAVAVLPYDPIRDEVVLVEQFRVGAMPKDKALDNPWLLEIIAGLVEDGESDEEVVHREAKEEANCILDKIQHVASFFPTPGGFSELAHVYIGKTDSTNLGGEYGLKEEGEDIRVHVMSSTAAIELLHKGRIRSAIPMIAMYNFIQLKQQLVKEWKS